MHVNTGMNGSERRKDGYGMFSIIRDNIRSFLDVTIFAAMIAIGLFAILSDYRYFKRLKYKKDAAVSFGIGLTCILLPFVLLIISRL